MALVACGAVLEGEGERKKTSVPKRSGEFCQVSELTIQKKKMPAGRGEMFIWSKLGQNPLEMDVKTFARIKKVIWDQLLAAKAETIQS